MRFAAAAVALAGAVIAQEAESTVYSTEYLTITSCAPTVTNCPARSTVVTSSVIPLTTSTIFSTTTRTVTQCPDTVSHCPAESTTVVTDTIAVSTTVCPVTETEAQPTQTPSVPPVVVSSESPETESAVPTGPGSIIPSYPTTTLASVAPACPTVSVKTIKTSVTTVIPTIIYETVEVPCATSVVSPPSSTPSGAPTGTNPGGPIATAGAATMGGSALLAVAAGLVALFA